ncbi:MAG: hypothetical protein JXQ87_18855 [Bacteroidia bacterium]
MVTTGKNSFTHAPWLVIAMLLLVVSGLIYQTTIMDHEADITKTQKKHLKEIKIELTALKANWRSEVEELTAIERGLDKATESYRLTELLSSTFKSFIRDANSLENGINRIDDTVGYFFVVNELNDIKTAWSNSKVLLGEHKNLLATFSQMSEYKIKVDSLRTLLSNETKRALLNASALAKAKAEMVNFENKLNELSIFATDYKTKSDSLLKKSNQQGLVIDSLTYNLAQQQLAYQEALKEAELNAVLANRLSIWYNEKVSRGRKKVRLLTNSKNDYNRGADLEAIYCEFSISADVYEPNKISEVHLYNVTDGIKNEKASVQVSVRNQKSGEFSLIPTEKLAKGKYRVEVEYRDSIILQQDFYVAK